jgi:hypothetical protein
MVHSQFRKALNWSVHIEALNLRDAEGRIRFRLSVDGPNSAECHETHPEVPRILEKDAFSIPILNEEEQGIILDFYGRSNMQLDGGFAFKSAYGRTEIWCPIVPPMREEEELPKQYTSRVLLALMFSLQEGIPEITDQARGIGDDLEMQIFATHDLLRV